MSPLEKFQHLLDEGFDSKSDEIQQCLASMNADDAKTANKILALSTIKKFPSTQK